MWCLWYWSGWCFDARIGLRRARQCLSLSHCVERLRPYIEGTHFTVIAYHYSFLWLLKLKEPTGRFARWIVKLQQFSYDLLYHKSKLHVVPDTPRSSCSECLGHRPQEQIGLHPQNYSQYRLVYNSIEKCCPSQSPVKSDVEINHSQISTYRSFAALP